MLGLNYVVNPLKVMGSTLARVAAAGAITAVTYGLLNLIASQFATKTFTIDDSTFSQQKKKYEELEKKSQEQDATISDKLNFYMLDSQLKGKFYHANMEGIPKYIINSLTSVVGVVTGGLVLGWELRDQNSSLNNALNATAKIPLLGNVLAPVQPVLATATPGLYVAAEQARNVATQVVGRV